MDTIYTVRNVCDILHLHENTVLRLLQSKQLKGYKVGKNWRIYEKDLTKYIKGDK